MAGWPYIGRHRLAVVAAGLLTAAGGALGDVDRQPFGRTPEPCRIIAAPPSAPPRADASFDRQSPLHADFADVLPVAGLHQASARPAAEPPPARELPDDPGSARLVLLAGGLLGALRVGRCARKLRLGAVPDWYHLGGPARIGGASVLDPEFSPPAICHTDPPALASLLVRPLRRDPPLRRPAAAVLTVKAPRAPPLCS